MQQGPFEEQQVRDLALAGTLGPLALVWREGAAGWSPLAELLAPAAPAAVTRPCARCANRYPENLLAPWGGVEVCAYCKPRHLAELRECAAFLPGQASYASWGTRFAARVRRGEIPMPSEDDHADKYLLAERTLTSAGYQNYEVSNWARPAGGRLHRSEHNLAYWRSQDWWGFGPGAHSHVNGVRWWNHKHPAKYTRALAEGAPAAVGREMLTPEQHHEERVLLELRIADGLPLEVLVAEERARLGRWVESGHAVVADGVVRLTLAGRLLADGIILDLLV